MLIYHATACSRNQLPQKLRSGISLDKHISSHHSMLLKPHEQGGGGANGFVHMDAEIQLSGQAQTGHLAVQDHLISALFTGSPVMFLYI